MTTPSNGPIGWWPWALAAGALRMTAWFATVGVTTLVRRRSGMLGATTASSSA